MLQLLYPWGLAALATLGGVLYLYFHVFRGRRLEVSALFLWDVGESLRTEGRRVRRPPITLPLLLELLAALLLSLLVAGMVWSHLSERKHAVVVLDSSASMSAGRGEESFPGRAAAKLAEVFELLGSSGRVTLIRSGGTVELLGGGPLSEREAAGLLATWKPADPPHSFGPAVELARSLAGPDQRVLLLTDGAAPMSAARGADVIALGIGRALENTGWIAAHWMGKTRLFALLKHFGTEQPTRTMVLESGGRELSRAEVDFAKRNPLPMVLDVPEGVAAVSLRLVGAADALAADDVLRITRPEQLAVSVGVDVRNAALRQHLRTALDSTGKVETAPRDSAWLALDFRSAAAPPGSARPFKVVFRDVPQEPAQPFVGPYFVNTLSESSALLRGVDLNGIIWTADPSFRIDPEDAPRREVLASAGDVPLIVAADNELILNLVPANTNLFQMPAWPVLISNVVDHVHERSPGLKRFSYRLGEILSFRRPARWQGKLEIRRPDGRPVAFDGDRITYGRLEHEGIYRVLLDEKIVAAIDVNLLAEAESDLTGARAFGALDDVKAAFVTERERRPFDREFFAIVGAVLLCCWGALERSKV